MTLKELHERISKLLEEHGDKPVEVMQEADVRGIESNLQIQSETKDVATTSYAVIIIGKELL